jgi:hypothetical protein
MRMLRMNSTFAIAVSLTLSALLGCGGTHTWSPGSQNFAVSTTPPASTATATGYTLSVFVKAPGSTYKPDSIVRFGNTVFIGYQMAGDSQGWLGSWPGKHDCAV